jgi:hypothetical protein
MCSATYCFHNRRKLFIKKSYNLQNCSIFILLRTWRTNQILQNTFDFPGKTCLWHFQRSFMNTFVAINPAVELKFSWNNRTLKLQNSWQVIKHMHNKIGIYKDMELPKLHVKFHNEWLTIFFATRTISSK